MSADLSSLLIARCDEHPCEPALTWLGDRTLDEAWAECPRGAWLLCLADRAGLHPPQDWTARHVVAPTFRRAGAAQKAAGLDDTLTEWADRLEADGVAVLRAARAAARAAVRDAAWYTGNAAWVVEDAAWGTAWGTAETAEHARCADALRDLWPEPPAEVVAWLDAEG